MKYRIAMNAPGDRKRLVGAVSDVTGDPVRYMGMPTCAYVSGGWMLDKNNVLLSPAADAPDAFFPIINGLRAGEYACEGALTVYLTPEDHRPGVADTMGQILNGKASLIKKALGTEAELTVREEEDHRLALPFFAATLAPECIAAALQFSECVYEQAVQQKRVTSRDRPVENEKYTFRCFLLRIGMIGKEYARSRKVLLAPLSGNSAFKSGPRGQKPDLSDLHEEAPASEA